MVEGIITIKSAPPPPQKSIINCNFIIKHETKLNPQWKGETSPKNVKPLATQPMGFQLNSFLS